MCVVSMVGDFYQDKWNPWPYQNPHQPIVTTVTEPTKPLDFNELIKSLQPPPNRKEFDALKKEVEEMKKLLERALKYDEQNNEPHCEMEDKVKLLKEVAKMVGVDLSEIFKEPQ